MSTYSADDAVSLIKNTRCFEGTLDDNSLYIKIEKYVPYICTAIHDGHGFRDELKKNCKLSENDRYHEEDPYTGNMIALAPIVLIPKDSRFEYDLNRGPNECIHKNAWGKEVWNRELSPEDVDESLRKYHQFYKICYSIIEAVLKKYKNCIIFDIHSYNIIDREYKSPPLFNIGTHFVDKTKYDSLVQYWIKSLSKITLPDIKVDVKENEVYFGKGFLAESVRQKYPDCLVLPTEVKKIYADEFKPEPYDHIINAIKNGFNISMLETVDVLTGQI